MHWNCYTCYYYYCYCFYLCYLIYGFGLFDRGDLFDLFDLFALSILLVCCGYGVQVKNSPVKYLLNESTESPQSPLQYIATKKYLTSLYAPDWFSITTYIFTHGWCCIGVGKMKKDRTGRHAGISRCQYEVHRHYWATSGNTRCIWVALKWSSLQSVANFIN